MLMCNFRLPNIQLVRSGLQFLSGWLDIADHVRYKMYSETKEACRRPELGWCSWMTGNTEATLKMAHRIMLKLMKNS